jgi:hypothetical protein
MKKLRSGVMKANYEDKILKQTSEISFGNLYEINQQLMSNEAKIADDVLKNKKQELGNWIQSHYEQKYLMLLNNDLHDYTIFNLNKNNDITLRDSSVGARAADDVIECMTYRGTLLALSLQEDGVWELWLKNAEGCFAYYLFPYGEAVIEY